MNVFYANLTSNPFNASLIIWDTLISCLLLYLFLYSSFDHSADLLHFPQHWLSLFNATTRTRYFRFESIYLRIPLKFHFILSTLLSLFRTARFTHFIQNFTTLDTRTRIYWLISLGFRLESALLHLFYLFFSLNLKLNDIVIHRVKVLFSLLLFS
jgi:hypothetical protein